MAAPPGSRRSASASGLLRPAHDLDADSALLFLGFVPIWESDGRGVAFETIGDPSVRATCSWPDREAFVEAMRRCVASQWRLSGGAEG